ncbi:MAG: AEC family transporter [Oscillospiraceae bacterium]|nr:AEC family transporter [Oscillospiraceae bacterium]
MDFTALLNKMVVFLALMVIGFVLARRGRLDRGSIKALSSLTLNVFLTGSILNSTLGSNVELSWSELGTTFLVVWVMQLLGYLIAWLVTLPMPVDKEHKPLFELLMSMGNSMFVALPIVDALFPESRAVFYVSLSCLPFNVLLFTYGVWRLQSGRENARFRFRNILSVPLLAALAALILFLVKPPLPKAVTGLISTLAGATTPLSMLVIGASLGSVSLLDAFKNGKLYVASAVRLLLIPVLTWLVLRLLTDDPVLLMTSTIVAASPAAVIITVMANQYDRDSVYTAEGTLQSTALSMLTIPLLVWLLG